MGARALLVRRQVNWGWLWLQKACLHLRSQTERKPLTLGYSRKKKILKQRPDHGESRKNQAAHSCKC